MPQPEPSAVSLPGQGTVLADRYALGALLGKGGMGHVYAARDRKLQRDVAVKLMGSATPDREALRRFGREALAAGAVQHPNVVAVFDAGEEHGRPFLVTELLRGQTLRELLEEGALPPDRALSVAGQIAAGLAAAHDKGFIHRDLKPENIFIIEDGWVKILDFGLVKLAESLHVAPPPEPNSTGDGRTLGTIGYMAPEQVRGQPVDQRADLFNFGLVLYEMLSGQRAFRGGTTTETSYAILFNEPAPLPGPVPRWLKALVLSCLSKDREKRPASAREVLEALQRREKGGARRNPWLPRLLPIVALLGAAVLSVVFFLGQPRKSRPPPAIAAAARPAGSVAILPFDAREAPDFAPLAEGVSDLLGRDFEGGSLHAIQTASVSRVVGGANSGDIDRARLAASQLGARYFILGRIEQKKGKLRIEAVLHDAETGNPVTQGGATSEPSDVLKPIRKLSDDQQGLPRTPAEFQERLARLAWRTTYTTDALLAWLEGERLYREVKVEQAVAALRRSVAADSEFALAHYKLGIALATTNPLSAEDEFEHAVRYKDHLNPPEQLIVQAHLALQRGFIAEAEEDLKEAARQFPGDGETWLELGDYYFHYGPLRGVSPQEAAQPLQRALSFDPVSTEAIYHLADLALLRGERQTVATLADRLLGLTDDPSRIARYRMARAWARNDQGEHDEVIAYARSLPRKLSALAFAHAFSTDAWLMDGFGDTLALAEAIGKRDGFQADATAHLIHGRPDAARAAFARAAVDYPNGDTPVHALWLDSRDEFFISPAQLAAARAKAELIAKANADDDRLPLIVYLSGVLAVRARDLAAAERVAVRLDAMPLLGASSIVADLVLALRARILEARNNPQAALQLLEKQKLKIPLRYERHYARIGEWFLRARLLEALGRGPEALPLYDALTFYSYSEPIFRPVAFLRKARIRAAAGDRQRAIEDYENFANAWKSCESSEQEILEAAQRDLKRLKQQSLK